MCLRTVAISVKHAGQGRLQRTASPVQFAKTAVLVTETVDLGSILDHIYISYTVRLARLEEAKRCPCATCLRCYSTLAH